jgi:hypothetical protein
MEGRSGVKSSPPHAPPGGLERALRAWLGEESAEAVWGDLTEEAAEVRRHRGPTAARAWMVWQWTSLMIGLITRGRPLRRRWAWEVMMDGWTARRRQAAAIVGVVAVLPAAALVIGGLLISFSGSTATVRWLEATVFNVEGSFYRLVLHPVVVLGGLALALGVNLIPLLGVQVDGAAGTARATVALRLRRTHLAIAAGGLCLLALILGYAFTENFEVNPRTPGRSDAPAAAPVAADTDVLRPR